MINTYNESKLHQTVKNLYALECGGKTEEKVGTYICDIVTDDEIIEVQTANVSKLKTKIAALIGTHRVRVIFPIAEQTVIETRSENGDVLSRRKSPKHETIFRLFREVTGLTPFFDEEKFSLTVLFVTQKVIRIKTEEAVQTKNKSRRFKKNWLIVDKELISINGERTFTSTRDYCALAESALKETESKEADTRKKETENDAKTAYNGEAKTTPKTTERSSPEITEKHIHVFTNNKTTPITTVKTTDKTVSVLTKTQTKKAPLYQAEVESIIPDSNPIGAAADTQKAVYASKDTPLKKARKTKAQNTKNTPASDTKSAQKAATTALAALHEPRASAKDFFTTKDLKNAGAGKYAPFAIWVLKKVSRIEELPRRGREKRYRFTNESE